MSRWALLCPGLGSTDECASPDERLSKALCATGFADDAELLRFVECVESWLAVEASLGARDCEEIDVSYVEALKVRRRCVAVRRSDVWLVLDSSLSESKMLARAKSLGGFLNGALSDLLLACGALSSSEIDEYVSKVLYVKTSFRLNECSEEDVSKAIAASFVEREYKPRAFRELLKLDLSSDSLRVLGRSAPVFERWTFGATGMLLARRFCSVRLRDYKYLVLFRGYVIEHELGKARPEEVAALWRRVNEAFRLREVSPSVEAEGFDFEMPTVWMGGAETKPTYAHRRKHLTVVLFDAFDADADFSLEMAKLGDALRLSHDQRLLTLSASNVVDVDAAFPFAAFKSGGECEVSEAFLHLSQPVKTSRDARRVRRAPALTDPRSRVPFFFEDARSERLVRIRDFELRDSSKGPDVTKKPIWVWCSVEGDNRVFVVLDGDETLELAAKSCGVLIRRHLLLS